MIRQLLEEVKSAPLDEASRQRLKEIHRRSIKELETGLAPELVEELERLTLPFTDDETPSDAELRIAQAQLVGWLEGLFHGIQTAIYAQQMAARAQFEQIRRALPPGVQIATGQPGQPGADGQPAQGEPETGPGSGGHVPLAQVLPPRERPRAPNTIRPSRPTSTMRGAGGGQPGQRGGLGVGDGRERRLLGRRWDRRRAPGRAARRSSGCAALVAGPVPPQLLANRSAASTSETARRTGSACPRSCRSARRPPRTASDFTVTRGEVMSPL